MSSDRKIKLAIACTVLSPPQSQKIKINLLQTIRGHTYRCYSGIVEISYLKASIGAVLTPKRAVLTPKRVRLGENVLGIVFGTFAALTARFALPACLRHRG